MAERERSSGDAPVVFISYSREDLKWRLRFVDMLAPVVRGKRLDVWSDDRNLVGEERRFHDALDHHHRRR